MSSDNLSYNSAFRHPHVFRQSVLQLHGTIRSTHLGAPIRSAVSGIKNNLRSISGDPHLAHTWHVEVVSREQQLVT